MAVKKATAKRKTRSRKKTTLAEFRAWLEGVEELQPADWAPNLEQWKLIRDKIKSVEDKPQEVIQHPPAPPIEMALPPPADVPPMPSQPAFLPPMPGTGQPTGLPPVPEMTPAAQAALAGKLPKQPTGVQGHASGLPPTTPVDNDDGSYSSNFAG